jgi:hypothetical protein
MRDHGEATKRTAKEKWYTKMVAHTRETGKTTSVTEKVL